MNIPTNLRFVASLSATLLSLSAAAGTPTSLNEVFEPVKTGVPPSDAYIGLSLLPSGEIRHYNYGEQAEPGAFYLSSTDGGLTWTKKKAPREMLFADIASPVSGEYIRLLNMGDMGTWCIRTDGGLEGNRTLTKVSPTRSIMLKPPVFAENGKRVIVAGHGDVNPKGCYTYVSTDDGITWEQSNIVTVPEHKGGGFHQGIRWNHGAVEPTVVELGDGKLWMIMRTPHDQHYESFSTDGGLTWSEAQPSRFYGTITMPTIGRLKDGRLLFFWCNTTPLPEMATANGVWDDVFTNRDVTHIAISDDDGKTWHGYRELMLDPMRNDSDYALRGGGIDRGMHQAEWVEVAPGKIVASIGQHPLHRALVAFDVEWLNEMNRSTDMTDSLKNWTTFNYIKGIKGHCSYNRVQGVELTSDAESETPVMHIRYIEDPSLVADSRGALWNFPAAQAGSLTTRIKIPADSKNVNMVLSDRWHNPSDSVSIYNSIYTIPLDSKKLKANDGKWHNITVDWDFDKDKGNAIVYVDGKKRMTVPMRNTPMAGLNYVHFIALPTPQPTDGIYIDQVEAKAKRK